MKHIYKILLLLLLPSLSMAQSNYKPGYVVSMNGDTLRGFIDYHEWERNPKDIRFKKDQNNGTAENYSTKNARAFAVTGQEYYERFTLSISQDYLDLAKLGTKIDNKAITDTVFLRVLNKGNHVGLYSYTDEIKPRFFLMEAGETQPQELDYHGYYNAEESASVKFVNRYRIQLQYVAQKYNAGSANGQIAQARYTEPDLIKIVQTINGNSSSQFTTEKLFGSRWFAGLGVNYSQLKFDVTSGNSAAGTSVTSNSTFPRISGGVDFFVNKNTRALVLRAELSFTVNHYTFTQSNASSIPQSTSTLDFKQYNPSITPQIIYNIYNEEKLKFFVGAGASFNISSYNHYQYITKFGGSFPDKVQDNYPAFSKFWTSFPLKAGVEINKKLEINIGYTLSSTITDDNTFSGNVKSYQAGINYFFGK